MKKSNKVIVKNPKELAESLGLSPSDAVEWEIRNVITKKIIECAAKNYLTVTSIAKDSGTSRGRVTKILKDNTLGISLDVLVRVLRAVGEEVKISFRKAA